MSDDKECKVCSVVDEEGKKLTPKQLVGMTLQSTDVNAVVLQSFAESAIVHDNPPGAADKEMFWVCSSCLIKYFNKVGVCDSHGAVWNSEKQMQPGSGYLFEARFMQRSIIQEKAIDQVMSNLKEMGQTVTREECQSMMESKQGSSPWLICDECISVLNLGQAEKDTARGAAKKFWVDKAEKEIIKEQKEVEKVESDSCFIATAAYGNKDAKDVVCLRKFRDKILRQSKTGKVLIKLYEFISPPIARKIKQSNLSRKLVRILLIKPSSYIAAMSLRKNQ